MPAFPHTLIGLGPFADLGCKIVFTKTSVIVYHPDGHPILSGWQDETGPRLWHFPLTAEAAQVALDNASPQPPIPLTVEAAHVAVDEASHPPQLPIPPPPPRAPPADVFRTPRKRKWRRKLTRSCHAAGKQRRHASPRQRQPITLTKIARSGGVSTPTNAQHITETHSRPNCQLQLSLRNLVSHIPARES